MTSKAQVNAEMTLGTSGVTKSLSHVNSEVGHFAKEATHKTREVFGDVSKEFVKVFAAGLSGGVVATAFETIKEGFHKSIEEENISAGFAAVFKNADKAKEAMAGLKEESEKHHFFTDEELLKAGSRLAPGSGGSVDKMKEMVKLAEKLKVISPTKTIDDATQAIMSANAGRMRGLTTGFGIDAKLLDQASKRHLKGVAAIEYALNAMGVTEKNLDATDNTMQATVNSVKQSWEDVGQTAADALGPAVAKEMKILDEFFKTNRGEIAETMKTLGDAALLATKKGAGAVAGVVNGVENASSFLGGLTANMDKIEPMKILKGGSNFLADVVTAPFRKSGLAAAGADLNGILHTGGINEGLVQVQQGKNIRAAEAAKVERDAAAAEAARKAASDKAAADAARKPTNIRITHPSSVHATVFAS